MAVPAPPLAAQTPAVRQTAEEIERHWLTHVYQGDAVPQLTVRAVVMGLALGIVMAFSNLYVGLKTGWGLGVAITACILSFSIFRGAARLGLLRSEPSILEINCLQSTASAAGYSSAATLVSAFSAYLMINGHHIPMATAMILVFFLAMLGVFMAVPMKRTMINVEQLPFPSGLAAAETLRSLYAHGGAAAQKARTLFVAMTLGAVLAWFRDGMQWITERLEHAHSRFAELAQWVTLPTFVQLPKSLQRGAWFETLNPIFSPAGYGFAFECSTILAAAGAIAGLRTSWSMLLGAVVDYGVLAPWMHHWAIVGADGQTHFVIDKLGYRGIVSWSVWPGVAMMTTAALFSFALQGKTLLRAFSGLGRILRREQRVASAQADLLAHIELPTSWFLIGFTVAAIGCVAVNAVAFHIAPWLGALAVLISFVLAIVACRATGETDTTPIGALGKITQLTYGILIPQNMTANLMTANVTATVAIASADLLTDLKSGYLLGANPRKQFLAQFFGVFAGAAVAVPGFYLLVPNASMLGGDKFPAPAAQVWKAVAELLAKGAHSLHETALWGMAIGGLVGILLTVAERAFPKHRAFIPSPTGLGLAFVIPCWSAVSFFIGGAIASIYQRRNPEAAELRVIPIAAGLIAGESLLGVAVALLSVL
jgi:OPT family oligopeptide transporter